MTRKKYGLEPTLTKVSKTNNGVNPTDLTPEITPRNGKDFQKSGGNPDLHNNQDVDNTNRPAAAQIGKEKEQEDSDDERKKSPGLCGFWRRDKTRQEMVGAFELVCMVMGVLLL